MITFPVEYNGLVIARYSNFYAVEGEDGKITQCVSRKKLSPLCGDFATWEVSGDGGVITSLMPRRGVLTRPDRRGQPKETAANIDQLIIVNALPDVGDEAENYTFNMALTDRYIVATELLGATPLILLNKCDLASAATVARMEQAVKIYQNIGYTTILTSTKAAIGIDALNAQLRDKTSIFVGESGAGKSSLINAIMPELAIRTNEVSAHSGLGKHTTTTTVLYHLTQGGHLIDSPGVREFGLWKVAPEQLAKGFKEFEPYLGECRFRNCSHRRNAGCAIETAAEAGEISSERMASYYRIYDDLNSSG
ncbi:MAG: ribosome small subunit-dependent GTPase A [Gammaproteobacteria bacterium]|nr:ribosome small subunit-dependent GTPase A [Gammaproteobacteria bacterium]